MLTFRIAITAAVIAFITALTASLVFTERGTCRAVARAAASAAMDAASANTKAALHKLPQADSFYIGYENGCWLQVRRVDVLGPAEREKLGAPPGAVYNVNLVRP